MTPTKSTYFPIVPMSAMRSTQNMSWLVAISEDDAVKEDLKWVLKETSLGERWVKEKLDKKTGETREYARKSPPNYARQRRHLIAQYDNRRAIKDYAISIGFEMPEDAFSVVIYFPMPKSWTKKKKSIMNGLRHKSRPDFDNCIKGIVDAIYYKNKASRFERNKGDTDAMISSATIIKMWSSDESKIGFWVHEYDLIEWDCALLKNIENVTL
jgi:Holliday junction resolvase RusA-like endonuclease